MKLGEFLNSLKLELEIESVEELSLETNLSDVDEWDSLGMLVLINFIQSNFNFEVNVEVLKGNLKISDLIKLIEKNSKIEIIK
ncbi:phosphopantetheine-binding protein [Flavobacteriaceae bacterium]|nr:phosphopantetheine-binding protein [Flavobacteriaceae bacterium]